MADADSSTRLAYELALWRLQEQIAYRAALDARLGQSFALSAALIALLGSAFLVGGTELGNGLRTGFTVATGLFVCSMVTATVAYLASRFAIAPNIGQLQSVPSNVQDEEFEEQVKDAILQAVDRNESTLQLKLWLVNVTTALTGATALTLALSLVSLL